MGFVPEKIAGSFDLYGSGVHVLLFRYWPCHPLARVAVGWLLFPAAGTAILFWLGKSFSLLRPDNTKAAFVFQEKVLEIVFSIWKRLADCLPQSNDRLRQVSPAPHRKRNRTTRYARRNTGQKAGENEEINYLSNTRHIAASERRPRLQRL